MQELWLPVTGYEGLYEVSSWARVKSLHRAITHCDGRVRQYPGKVLKPAPNAKGYLTVSLCKNGVSTTHAIHSLVAAAFIGPRPPGLQVLHGSAGQHNNSPSNLSYGTPKENEADKLRDGTHTRGERNG